MSDTEKTLKPKSWTTSVFCPVICHHFKHSYGFHEMNVKIRTMCVLFVHSHSHTDNGGKALSSTLFPGRFLPIIEDLCGTRYEALQIKGELTPVHSVDLNLHHTIECFFVTISDND